MHATEPDNAQAARDSLYPLTRQDIPKAASVLADAFQHDPLWQIIFAGEAQSDKKYQAFFETPLKYSFKYGNAYATSANLEGIVTLVPGEYAAMPLWRMVLSGAIFSGLRIGPGPAKKLPHVFNTFSAARDQIMQGRPFLYVPVVGVAQKFQGQGFGKRLIQSLIEQSEARNLPLYLETETEDNVAMYRAFGFEVRKDVVLPVLEHPVWMMLREPHHEGSTHRT